MYHNKIGQILIGLFFVAFIEIECYTAMKIASPDVPEYKTVNRTLEKQNLDSLNATIFSPLNKTTETPKKPITVSKLKTKTATNKKPVQPEVLNGTQTIPTNSEKRKIVYVDEDGNEMTICINCNEKEDKNTNKMHKVSSITFKGFEVEWANDGSETDGFDDLDDSLEDNQDTAEDIDDDSDENLFFSHDTEDSEEDKLRNKLNIQ